MKKPVVVANSDVYHLPFPFFPVTITRFADREIRPYIEGDVTGKDVIYIASLYPETSDNVLEWMLTVDALKRKKVASITAVIPYMPYIRQSRVHRKGESLSAEVVAKMLSASGVDRILTFDLHNTSALSFFTVPVTHVSAISLLPSVVHVKAKDTIIVSPDEGSVPRAEYAVDLLHLPLVVLQKQRSLVVGDKMEKISLHDDVAGKTIVMVDDIISTGSTIAKAATLLKNHGAKDIIVFAVHAVFSGNAKEVLETAPIDRLIITDTLPRQLDVLPKKIERVSVAPLIQKAVVQ